jgi:hypothetical protein
MKTLTALILGLTLGTLSLLVPLKTVHAQTHSAFSAAQIERAIIEYYDFFNQQQPTDQSADAGTGHATPSAPLLEDADLIELADALADQLAILPPIAFNDVLGHLMADYRHHADHRAPIELLVAKIYTKIAGELQQRRESHPVLTVIGDTFTAFGVAYAFGFGRAAWGTRGRGLRGIARFQAIVQGASDAVMTRNARLAVLLGGTSVGIAHALYNHLETQRLDPSLLLRNTRADLARDLSRRIAELRAEVEQAIQLDEGRSAAERASTLQRREQTFRRASDALPSLTQEVEQLHSIAPALRGTLEPAHQDLRNAIELCLQLARRLPENSPVLHGAPGVSSSGARLP